MISFVIPTKKEPLLWDTINDLKENADTKIEILWKEDRGQGQRAIINELVAQAKYDLIAKVDAHCSFGPGFDSILLEVFEEDMILAPLLYPLDPKTWTVNHHNKMGNFAFNTDMAVEHVPGDGESMCMQGSFFMTTKRNMKRWNLCDESLGSWGHQGTELGIRAFLNEGRCFITNKTYYGHVFRHTEKEFPYRRSQKQIEKTHNTFIEKFRNKDIQPLIEKFNYPLDWSPEKCGKIL